MTEQQKLLHALIVGGDIESAKGIYADWLDENGMPDEARQNRSKHYSPVWKNSPFESLIGKTVVSVHMPKGTNAERFVIVTDEGENHTYRVEGDCCSSSWLYRIVGLKYLIGQKVICCVQDISNDVEADDGLCKQEEDSVYSVGLVTASGICEIVHRNSSNGYYGGMLDRAGDDDGLAKSPPIESDWLCDEAKPKEPPCPQN